MIDERKVTDAIRAIFQGSPYHFYLARNAHKVGFYFDGGEAIVLGLDPARFRVDLAYHPQYMDPEPDLWVQCDPEALVQRATADQPVENLRVRVPMGQKTHPVVEKLVRRTMAPLASLPSVSEREELIYPALFKSAPQVVWKSADGKRKVLRFLASVQGRDAYVTSGFTNPDLGPSPISDTQDELMGYGYELCLFCEASARPLAEQLIAWANQLDRTGKHILVGGWLQHTDATIPGTDLSGFVVVLPTWIPKRFPVCGGVGELHVLLGVTAGELSIAKARSSADVIKALAAAGITDSSPMRRKSVF